MKHCATCTCERRTKAEERRKRERAAEAQKQREREFVARHSALTDDDIKWARERLSK